MKKILIASLCLASFACCAERVFNAEGCKMILDEKYGTIRSEKCFPNGREYAIFSCHTLKKNGETKGFEIVFGSEKTGNPLQVRCNSSGNYQDCQAGELFGELKEKPEVFCDLNIPAWETKT